MRVISLFNGASMAYPALLAAGVPASDIKYLYSEIDGDANLVTLHRVPDAIGVGDIRLLNGAMLVSADLIIAGSPCTSLSVAARQKESGLEQGESTLFWEFVRIIEENRPKYFLLENVASMKQADKDTITDTLGVEPILINSKLVSGQLRSRLYWTNIPDVTQPEDKGIKLENVLEYGYTDREKSYCLTATYNRACPQDYFMFGQRQMIFTRSFKKYQVNGVDSFEFSKYERIHALKKKGGIKANDWLHDIHPFMRKLTPRECERLQTLPEDWTAIPGLSDAQRTKIIGNGFTVDVIAHILSFMPEIKDYDNFKK